jgi:hypothetical protein
LVSRRQLLELLNIVLFGRGRKIRSITFFCLEGSDVFRPHALTRRNIEMNDEGVALENEVGPLAGLDPAERRPVAALYELDHWRLVMGSDTISFVLYEDGEVIYRVGHPWEMRSVQLGPRELRGLIARLAPGGFAKLNGYYNAAFVTCQPMIVLKVWWEGVAKRVGVVGNLRTANSARAAVPASLLRVFDALAMFEHPRAVPWLPPKIEVLLTNYSHARTPAVSWPQGWPGLDDPSTRASGSNLYSVFVDASGLEMVQAFERDSAPVLLDGNKWSVSYRFPVPNESLIRQTGK